MKISSYGSTGFGHYTAICKNEGFKYPFNATEILYCDNNTVIEKMIQMILKNLKKNEEKPQEEPTKEEGRT